MVYSVVRPTKHCTCSEFYTFLQTMKWSVVSIQTSVGWNVSRFKKAFQRLQMLILVDVHHQLGQIMIATFLQWIHIRHFQKQTQITTSPPSWSQSKKNHRILLLAWLTWSQSWIDRSRRELSLWRQSIRHSSHLKSIRPGSHSFQLTQRGRDSPIIYHPWMDTPIPSQDSTSLCLFPSRFDKISWLGVTNGEVIEWRLRWWQSNPCQCSLWWAGQVFDNKAHQSSHSTLNTPSIFHNQSMVETFPPRSHAQVDPTKCKNQVTPFDITAKPSQGSKNGFRSLWGSLVSKTQSGNLDAAPPRPMEIKTTHSHVRGRFLVRNFSLS